MGQFAWDSLHGTRTRNELNKGQSGLIGPELLLNLAAPRHAAPDIACARVRAAERWPQRRWRRRGAPAVTQAEAGPKANRVAAAACAVWARALRWRLSRTTMAVGDKQGGWRGRGRNRRAKGFR